MLGDFLRELSDYSFRDEAERSLRDRLIEMVDKADNMKHALEVQKELARVIVVQGHAVHEGERLAAGSLLSGAQLSLVCGADADCLFTLRSEGGLRVTAP